MTRDNITRYDPRKDGEQTWEIYDTWTGLTVVVAGHPRCKLPLDEADVMAELMNSYGWEPDEETRH